MAKQEIIEIANSNNGYLYSKIIKENKIPTALISRLFKDKLLTKVARGIYITDKGIEDELFINSLKYSKIIYSGETGLYLNNLSNKQAPIYEFTIPYGTNMPTITGYQIKYTRKNISSRYNRIENPIWKLC